jgi:beta-glucosidase
VVPRIALLLNEMTLPEKIGQMSQFNGSAHNLEDAIRQGRVGSVLNEVDVETVNRLQRIAIDESRLGIPLLIGRDVIHGFKTVFPIPLGQAASWNPGILKEGARIGALEASAAGVNWTFAPMIDITRDPRWGRIAECLGEDPYLGSVMATAMVDGFQGENFSQKGSIAACAKHFAGYGAVESGADYNTTNIPETELRNVYLPPFKAAADAGVATFMTSFSDLNGIPASASEFLLKQVLRSEWGYKGFVVSDWESIHQLVIHGLTPDDKESAFEAANAGLDMEMVSTTYADHLESLVLEGRISEQQVDTMVANILRVKLQLALFENTYTDPEAFPEPCNSLHLEAARQAAMESCVLLRNRHEILPLSLDELSSIAVIGPMAHQPVQQMGTWVFDGDPDYCQTGLDAIRALAGDDVNIQFAPGLPTTRSCDHGGFTAAVNAAEQSDAVIMFVGEEAILSGEAHCRADIDLPGHQQQLIEAVAKCGKPITLVVMAGRPLTLDPILTSVDAILYVSFPRMVGQIPIYYARKNTGKPTSAESFVHIDDIDADAAQTSLGMTCMHLDAGFEPLFPFGFGLSYTNFSYADICTNVDNVHLGDSIEISALVTNTGTREAEEVVQLYIRDLYANITRPVRELKGFQKIRLQPGQQKLVRFNLHTDDLAFYNRHMQLAAEPGEFHAWIGGDSNASLRTEFKINE